MNPPALAAEPIYLLEIEKDLCGSVVKEHLILSNSIGNVKELFLAKKWTKGDHFLLNY